MQIFTIISKVPYKNMTTDNDHSIDLDQLFPLVKSKFAITRDDVTIRSWSSLSSLHPLFTLS